jgi:hypothetical protein
VRPARSTVTSNASASKTIGAATRLVSLSRTCVASAPTMVSASPSAASGVMAGATSRSPGTEAEETTVPVAEEVVLRRESTPNGDRVDVEVRVSWRA